MSDSIRWYCDGCEESHRIRYRVCGEFRERTWHSPAESPDVNIVENTAPDDCPTDKEGEVRQDVLGETVGGDVAIFGAK